VEFIVTDQGNASTINILDSIGSGCDEEATRVVGMMKFSPATKDGKAVNVKFILPVKFVIK
jgi:protein TonB